MKKPDCVLSGRSSRSRTATRTGWTAPGSKALQSRRCTLVLAFGATPPQFDHRVADLEASFARADLKALEHRGIEQFLDCTAIAANGEDGGGVTVLRISAGDVSVDGFEAVDEALLDEPVERPVDGGRSRNAVRPNRIEDLVRGHRGACSVQGAIDLLMIGSKGS